MKTLALRTDIPESREVHLTLPRDVPTGPAEIVLVIDSDERPAAGPAKIRTFGDLLASGFVGSWADRDDITDSAEFARQLREQTWRPRYSPDGEVVDDGAAR